MIKTIKCDKIIWYYIDIINDETLEFLKNNFKFHPLDLKDVAGQAEETKIDIYKNYIFLIVQFPFINREKGLVDYVEIDIFIGIDFVITIQKGKSKTLRDFYYRAQNNAAFRRSIANGDTNLPGYILYRILERLYRDTHFMVDYLTHKVRELEDRVYSHEVSEDIAREIAYTRRKILSLKRIFEPQLEVLHNLSQLKNSFFPETLNVYFDDLDDYVEKIWNFLDNQKYAMKDLLEVHDSLLTHTTNKIIKILTVISVAMLPLTLLSGIYGMNIDLPLQKNPMAVGLVFAFFLFIILIFVFYFRKKKLL